MRKLFDVFLILALASSFCCASGNMITLAKSSKANADIVLPQDATAPEKTAVNELADNLKQITGADFQISSAPDQRYKTHIYIGQTRTVKSMLPGFKWSTVKGDGIIIKTIGNDLILSGDRPRGTLYAVYTFLENYLGVRWWSPDSSYVPTKSILKIKDIDIVYKPPFFYRETMHYNVAFRNHLFGNRLKLNGPCQSSPEEYGGNYSIIGWCHTFYIFMNPAAYFHDHPEWFALVNGKRVSENAQLCLTNEEMKKTFFDAVLYQIRTNPGAGIISVSQNDAMGMCECDKCRALVKKTGSESGALLTFVNSVAEEVEKADPRFIVDTLAYMYTVKPPTSIKPRENVIIRLCTIRCDFSKPLDSMSNQGFYKDLHSWRNISNHLAIWDYVTNFTNFLIPQANLHVLGPNLRIMAKNHVESVFEQGDDYNPDASFAVLKTWMLAHLMWNPYQNDKKLIKEFVNGYYGAASPYIERYINLLSTKAFRSSEYLGQSNIRPAYLTAKDFGEAFKQMDAAETAVANDPVLSKRVLLQRVELDHAYLICKSSFNDRDLPKLKMTSAEMAKRFVQVSDESGNNYITEGGLTPDSYKSKLAILAETKIKRNGFSSPCQFSSLNTGNRIEIQDIDFALQAQEYVERVKDPNASDGSACKMPGGHVVWAIQALLSKYAGTKGELFVTARCNGKQPSGKAFTIGVYDNELRTEIAERTVDLKEIKNDGYMEYSLGDITVKPDMYFYAAPCGNAEGVDSISIDRIYFIPAGSK